MADFIESAIEASNRRWEERKKRVPASLLYDPCLCDTVEEHEGGQQMQAKMRKDFRIPDDLCVGCYLGDDGPSMHDYSYGCEYYT